MTAAVAAVLTVAVVWWPRPPPTFSFTTRQHQQHRRADRRLPGVGKDMSHPRDHPAPTRLAFRGRQDPASRNWPSSTTTKGPSTGSWDPQTVQAIQDLQRQAGLPQTGAMNSATEAALHNYLIHGNSQMNPAARSGFEPQADPDPRLLGERRHPAEAAGPAELLRRSDQRNHRTQTTQAITYLQRQAGLPQTGQMNAATQAALNNYLIHGNNQMAG